MRNQAVNFSRLAIASFALVALTACGGGGGGSGGSATPAPPATPVIVKALTVSSATPSANAPYVDPRSPIIVAFSVPLSAGFDTKTVELNDGTKNVPIQVTVERDILTVVPTEGMRVSTNYRLTVKAGAAGTDGSQLKTDYVLQYRTIVFAYDRIELTPSDMSVFGANFPRLRIADVNGDKRADLVELAALHRPDVFAANGYTINIYLQNAAGAFSKLQQTEMIVDQNPGTMNFNNLAVQDMDSDGAPELLVPEYRAGDGMDLWSAIAVFKMGSDGKFALERRIDTPFTEDLVQLDVDGDGRMDLVSSASYVNTRMVGGFQVLHNTTGGFVNKPPVLGAPGLYSMVAADVDQDGKRELIINAAYVRGDNAPASFSIYSQGSPAEFSLNHALSQETVGFCTESRACSDMRLSDLNNDGKPDLVFSGYTLPDNKANEPLILAFSRRASGGWVKNIHQGTGFSSQFFGIHDVDGDSLPDFLVLNSMAHSFEVVGVRAGYKLEFSKIFETPVFDTMELENVAIGDINGDGRPDIVFDSYNSGIVMARSAR